MALLILLRHGESQWNLENRFTGWVDIDLSERGIKEAEEAGKKIKDIRIDKIYTSALKRAYHTMEIVLKVSGKDALNIPVVRDQALNERHYGDLQGLNKAETAKKYGEEQVHIWRRSYDVAPPNGESLKDTAARTLPFYRQFIEPDLKAGKNIFVPAHGNSLRSIVMELDHLSKEEVMKLNIPTGVPILYEFDKKLKVISKKVLQDPASGT